MGSPMNGKRDTMPSTNINSAKGFDLLHHPITILSFLQLSHNSENSSNHHSMIKNMLFRIIHDKALFQQQKILTATMRYSIIIKKILTQYTVYIFSKEYVKFKFHIDVFFQWGKYTHANTYTLQVNFLHHPQKGTNNIALKAQWGKPSLLFPSGIFSSNCRFTQYQDPRVTKEFLFFSLSFLKTKNNCVSCCQRID